MDSSNDLFKIVYVVDQNMPLITIEHFVQVLLAPKVI